MRQMKAILLQQVESHLLKISLVKISDEIKTRRLNARIVPCVHDSIWVEAAVDEAAEVCEIMERVMATMAGLTVPMKVEIDSPDAV
jgi:DNA polymerase I-like protein with 3'-5' exonuclease and polymerase domains